MAPYPIAPPPEEVALLDLTEQQAETLPLPKRPEVAPGNGRAPRGGDKALGEKTEAHALRELFAEALLEMSTTHPKRRTLDFFLSLFIHALLLGMLLALPLYFTEVIDLKQFTQTFLVAPPPPPPPPPASPVIAKVPSVPKRAFTISGKLLAPTAIPRQVAMLKEEALPPDLVLEAGIVGGVPGGVPGGQVGGVIGGIISGTNRPYIPPAPTAAAPKTPIRVGGRLKAPRAPSRPAPVYPILARQAKLQGDVLIDAVIDTAGNVVEMQALSGHPLLIPAAMEALRKWKYEPTYLNDEPVPVQLVVTVRFRLSD